MAEPATTTPRPLTDKDLLSAQEARRLADAAKAAAPLLAEFSQERIDAIVDAMADAVRPRAEELARLAVEETGSPVHSSDEDRRRGQP
jgi:acyl-CoA reductase-like NAD-dependent aldehyde dehydrogenase